MEFLAPFSDDEEINLPDQIAQLALDPMTAVFEKPSDDERQHLKAIFVKGRVDGQLVSKILIDGGAAINIMSYVMYQKLGKGDQDLTKTDMMLEDFEGNVSLAKGVVCVELTIGSKTLPTTFFVINGKGAYNLLLGRDWIHATTNFQPLHNIKKMLQETQFGCEKYMLPPYHERCAWLQ